MIIDAHLLGLLDRPRELASDRSEGSVSSGITKSASASPATLKGLLASRWLSSCTR